MAIRQYDVVEPLPEGLVKALYASLFAMCDHIVDKNAPRRVVNEFPLCQESGTYTAHRVCILTPHPWLQVPEGKDGDLCSMAVLGERFFNGLLCFPQ